MIATSRLYGLLGVLAVAGLVAAVIPTALPIWTAGFGVLCAAALGDWIALRRHSAPEMSREMPDSFALGVWTEITVELANPGSEPVAVELFDRPPPMCDVEGMPARVDVDAKSRLTLTYRVRPDRRGQHHFEPADVRVVGPLGLLMRQDTAGEKRAFRVLPNFRAVSRYALLATADRVGAMGIRKVRRRGEGMEFSRLREYRQGDLSRQIDWKASARRDKLISREYEDERDQHVVFMLDCGRRMRARDGELSHFDRCLNATLLLSHVALRQGDSVALATFGGHDLWVPRQKGAGGIQAILESVYDLESTTAPSDFSEAARRLFALQRRRALVVLMTNLYDQLDEDLLEAITLLRRRHVVLIASLREEATDALTRRPIDSYAQARNVAAGHLFLQKRRAVHDQLESHGGLLLDVAPRELSVQLVNRYLAIKRTGML